MPPGRHTKHPCTHTHTHTYTYTRRSKQYHSTYRKPTPCYASINWCYFEVLGSLYSIFVFVLFSDRLWEYLRLNKASRKKNWQGCYIRWSMLPASACSEVVNKVCLQKNSRKCDSSEKIPWRSSSRNSAGETPLETKYVVLVFGCCSFWPCQGLAVTTSVYFIFFK